MHTIKYILWQLSFFTKEMESFPKAIKIAAHCVVIINDYPFQKVTFESLKGDIGVLSSIP